MAKRRTTAKRVLRHPLEDAATARSRGRPLGFTGRTGSGLARWQADFRRALGQAMGKIPRRTALRPEVLERRRVDGYWREKIVFDVEADLSACAWLCGPLGKNGGGLPAVLCCHGPGPGKDPLVGLWQGKPRLEYHKLIAVRLAQQGFLTLTLDRRGHGERSAVADGHPTEADLSGLDAFYQGRGSSLLAMDIWDGRRALDLLAARDDVDAARVACMGIEAGATVAAGITALDRRVAAVALTSFISNELRFPGGAQLPTLACRTGPVDLCAVLAPRPLLLQIPLADSAVPAAEARRAARQVRDLYQFAGSDACRTVVFDGVLELDLPSLTGWLHEQLNMKEQPS